MRFFKFVFWVPVVLNLVAVTIGSRALELVSKPLLMPLLALSVFILAKEHDIRDRRVKLIVLALLFGALGDTLLMAGGGGWFISGMFAFLIGHILYFSVLPSPLESQGPLRDNPLPSAPGGPSHRSSHSGRPLPGGRNNGHIG